MISTTDPLHNFIENILLPNHLTGVAVHSNSDSLTCRVYICGRVLKSNVIPIAKVAEKIAESGKWCDNEIVLLACNSGTEGILSPAQQLSDEMCCMV